jgi:hypothetical protein
MNIECSTLLSTFFLLWKYPERQKGREVAVGLGQHPFRKSMHCNFVHEGGALLLRPRKNFSEEI